MRQRAAIARSLALGSEMLLLDEPFGALDPANRAHLQDLLLQIWRGSAIKRTVIFVTHDVEEALYLGERIVVLGTLPGRIIADVPVDIPHPRNRQDLFSSALFKRFSEQIVGYFHSDMEKKSQSFASTGYGAFILNSILLKSTSKSVVKILPAKKGIKSNRPEKSCSILHGHEGAFGFNRSSRFMAFVSVSVFSPTAGSFLLQLSQ
jgi:ABC-type proline/glycine betaine transport system ATPase subunit